MSDEEYDIVALRVAMGTATLQTQVDRLDDEATIRGMRNKVLDHAGKCFDEALTKAKEEWKKLSGGFSGETQSRPKLMSTRPPASRAGSQVRKRQRSTK